MKILIIALSGIGDALMFSPALKLLRQKYESSQIDLLSMFKGVEELYLRNPDISNVYYWNFMKENPVKSLLFVLELRKIRYDATINVYPSNRWPYNLISFLIGAPIRIGHIYNHTNFRSLNFLNNRKIKEDDLKHNVLENVALLEFLNINVSQAVPPLQVILTKDDETSAEQWLIDAQINSSDLIVGFHAGSATLKNHINRRWAPEKFAELAKILIDKYKAKVLLFGGPDEYELNDNINSLTGTACYVVKVKSLMTTAALMRKCKVFVVNDSGLMHIASGLQLPVVTIFAYTNPNYVHPWMTDYILVRHELECSPCFYYSPRPAKCKLKENKFKCIREISVNEVFLQVEKMLIKTGAVSVG
ncbi:MAG: ADP-heptose--lipooligosaccharide heptosyltransferase II [Ignavibacteriae bacterium]|nr:MAG: ADP-heptose--lipooligosaccharide heptosyltransferase II [Ignavibacteriota bacterium]